MSEPGKESIGSVFTLDTLGIVVLGGVIILGVILATNVGSGSSAAGEATGSVTTAPGINRNAPGIADEKPADLPENAQVVSIDPDEGGGYMVPYEAEIPGFNASYHMTPIPGGTFTMGSPEDEPDRGEDEGPQFEVEVEPFWMGTYPVTWGEYKQFMSLYAPMKVLEREYPVGEEDQADAVTIPTPLYYPHVTYQLGDDAEHPAVTMTPYAAQQYAQWLSKLTGRFYRLPTEAEWEYAARAGTTTAWSFGDDVEELDDYSWNYTNSGEGYHHVGSKKPNPWGLYDVHGNVANIVMDQYIEDHYEQFADAEDPVHWRDALAWPENRSPIVVRGGSWDNDPEWTRSAFRWHTDEDNWKQRDPNRPLSPWWYTEVDGQMTGFRLVRPLHEPDRETQLRFWGARPEDLPEETWYDVSDRLEEGRGIMGLMTGDLPERLELAKELEREQEEEEEQEEAEQSEGE